MGIGVFQFERCVVMELSGLLVVAAPAMGDPNFNRTVIYMLQHNHLGSLGVVLNRPTGHDLPDALQLWKSRISEPSVIFRGGPVSPEGIIALGRKPDSASIEAIDLLDSSQELDDLRLFHGYAGWGPAQLDDEIGDNAWFILEAEAGDVFTYLPDGLWRRVLRRQPGELGWLGNAPDDLSLN
jgi:putative transcriptional regulator